MTDQPSKTPKDPAFQEYKLLDLLDCSVSLLGGSSTLYSEPGCAHITAENLSFGYAAYSKSRLEPSRSFSRFWKDLTLDPSNSENSQVRHHGDLAWHQLGAIKNIMNDHAIDICVSSDLDDDQLALLSGICESRDIKVRNFINRSLAQLRANGITENATHIEIQLHDSVISYFEEQDGQIKLSKKETLTGLGLFRLTDRWLDYLRQSFISSSRFDPLHSGISEQQLFDAISHAFSVDQDFPSTFSVDTENKTHRIDTSFQELHKITQHFCDEIRRLVHSSQNLHWDSLFSKIPGFEFKSDEYLCGSGDTVSGAYSLSRPLESHNNDEGAGYIDEYPVERSSAQSISSDAEIIAERAMDSATHLFHAGLIYSADTLNNLIELIQTNIEFRDDSFYMQSGDAIKLNGRVISNESKVTTGQEYSINGIEHPVVGARMRE